MYVTGRQRHNQALLAPSGNVERAIVKMLLGFQEYQQLLDESDPETTRAILNQGLSDIARGLQTLTQGPTGRLDADLLAEQLAAFVSEVSLSLVQTETEPARQRQKDRLAIETEQKLEAG